MSFPTTRLTLLSRMRKGDESAWSEFVSAYTPSAFAFLWRFGLSEADAEDLWQEVLLKASSGVGILDSYKADKGRFKSWLMTVLRSRFQDRNDKVKAIKRSVDKTVSGDAPLSPHEPDGLTRFAQLEDESIEHFTKSRRAVAESLDQMLRDYPDEQAKRAFLDWFWNDEGLTDEEIADRHSLGLGQLRYKLKQVKSYLRQRWESDPGL